MVSVYLASPYGFAQATQRFQQELKAVLTRAGFAVKDPWELSRDLVERTMARAAAMPEKDRQALLRDMNSKVGEANRNAIAESRVMVAVLDGADVDSGTASEVGYAAGLGEKIIIGYRGDFRRTGENEAAIVNLQVQFWIEASGGRIVRSLDELSEFLKKLKPGI